MSTDQKPHLVGLLPADAPLQSWVSFVEELTGEKMTANEIEQLKAALKDGTPPT